MNYTKKEKQTITLTTYGNIYTVTCGECQRVFETFTDALRCIEMLNELKKEVSK